MRNLLSEAGLHNTGIPAHIIMLLLSLVPSRHTQLDYTTHMYKGWSNQFVRLWSLLAETASYGRLGTLD